MGRVCPGEVGGKGACDDKRGRLRGLGAYPVADVGEGHPARQRMESVRLELPDVEVEVDLGRGESCPDHPCSPAGGAWAVIPPPVAGTGLTAGACSSPSFSLR